MNKGAILAGVALALFAASRARAATATAPGASATPQEYEPPIPTYDPVYGVEDSAFYAGDAMSLLDWGANMAQANSQIEAILYLIRTAETGAWPDSDRYFAGYGYRRFFGTDEHPIKTGELKPVPLSDEMCRNAGFKPGCVSTAAGAYQFRRATWDEMRAAGKWGARLPDFSPASQDEAARRLLGQLGVPAMLAAGNITGAINAAGTRWASLPGSTAKQKPITIARALSIFNEGLAYNAAGMGPVAYGPGDDVEFTGVV